MVLRILLGVAVRQLVDEALLADILQAAANDLGEFRLSVGRIWGLEQIGQNGALDGKMYKILYCEFSVNNFFLMAFNNKNILLWIFT